MKWILNQLKFVSEIYTWAATFFEVTTEAEIHAGTEANTGLTLKGIQEKAKTDATAAVKEQMDAFQKTADDLKATVETLQNDTTAKADEVAKLTEQVNNLTSTVQEKDKEITQAKAEADQKQKELAAEVAKLKAGNGLENDQKTDGVQDLGGKNAVPITVIKNDTLKKQMAPAE